MRTWVVWIPKPSSTYFTGWTSSRQPRPERAMCPWYVPSVMKEYYLLVILQTVHQPRLSGHMRVSYHFHSQGFMFLEPMVNLRSATEDSAGFVFAFLSAAICRWFH